jgi:HlyD family secretion protein
MGPFASKGYSLDQANVSTPAKTDGQREARAAMPDHHRRWQILFVIVVLAIGGVGGARLWYGPEVVGYRAVRGDLVKTVVASGHVETPFRVEIAAQITGSVADVLVDEGQIVKAGQPLIAIDKTELQASVVQAEGAQAQAEARLKQLRELTLPAAQEALKQAQATQVNAEAAFSRAQQLAKSGYGTQVALDDALKTLDVGRTQVRTAELQVFTSSPGGSDYVLAETQERQAEANLAVARARLSYATISSPRDGTLISRNVERGSIVSPGKALLVLAPAGDTQLVVQIDEKNLGLLKVGQHALGSAVAYADQTFPAELAYINPSVDIARASVEVKLTARNPPAYLRQDMTISVDIEVDRRDGTTIVPARVVHDATTANPFVLVARNGRAVSQPVRLGIRGNDQIEILDGVTAGDVLIPVASGVRAGQRIRAVTQ